MPSPSMCVLVYIHLSLSHCFSLSPLPNHEHMYAHENIWHQCRESLPISLSLSAISVESLPIYLSRSHTHSVCERMYACAINMYSVYMCCYAYIHYTHTHCSPSLSISFPLHLLPSLSPSPCVCVCICMCVRYVCVSTYVCVHVCHTVCHSG